MARVHHRTHKGASLDFTTHPYQIGILEDESPERAVQKSVQGGISEIEHCGLMADCDAGLDTFYLFPTVDLRDRVVSNRINKMIGHVPLYRRLVAIAQDEAEGQAANRTGLKHIGRGSVAFVGSNQVASLAEFPAQVVRIDEYDNCDAKALVLVEDRLGHAEDPKSSAIGNPSFEGSGINALYESGDQQTWWMDCPSCGLKQTPTWWDNVVRQVDEGVYELRTDPAALVCRACNSALERHGQGEWVAAFSGRAVTSFKVSQLFAGMFPMPKLWTRFQQAQGDETKLQAFHNSILGEAYSASDLSITESLLNALVGAHQPAATGVRCAGGVDVGPTYLRVWVLDLDGLEMTRAGIMGSAKALKIVTLTGPDHWDQLISLVHQFPGLWVCDGRPEFTKAKEIQRVLGVSRFLLADHVQSNALKDINWIRKGEDRGLLKYRKVPTMDASHAALVRRLVTLPVAASSIPNLWPEMTNLVRITDGDVAKWVKLRPGTGDHFRDSFNYAWMAVKLLMGTGQVFVERL